MNETGQTKILAVFENVVTKIKKDKIKKKRKFRTHRFSDDESSASESELVINENEEKILKKPKSTTRMKLKGEPVIIKCQWEDCGQDFNDMEKLETHVMKNHVSNDRNDLTCKWENCPESSGKCNALILMRHLSYHCYLAKLINTGQSILDRDNNLPECKMERNYVIKIPANGYTCDWEGCDNITFNTIHEFLGHTGCHVQGGISSSSSKRIPCRWKGCTLKFKTRYKLGEHFRVHTKERIICCPTCITQFGARLVFADHRKRQLKPELRSFQCSQCLKLFSNERILSDHVRLHINQYKCTMCDMTCPKPSMLAKHITFRHMDIRRFSCNVCQKTFVTKSNLNTHLVTHQKNPFKCDQCDFGCKTKVGLNSHISNFHQGEAKCYECHVCNNYFARGDNLTIHLMRSHNFRYPCGHCRFKYRKDTDGIHRLQIVRYESLEVTEQMLKSQTTNSTVTYDGVYVNDFSGEYKLTITIDDKDFEKELPSDDSDNVSNNREIVITIEDVDDDGNIIRKTELNSNELNHFMAENDDVAKPTIRCSRDMPEFETIFTKIET